MARRRGRRGDPGRPSAASRTVSLHGRWRGRGLMQPILFIVFLPLLAAIVAGLGNRALGNVPAKVITTGSLFVGAALSWPIFLHYLAGNGAATVTPVFQWVSAGDLSFNWELRVDTLTAVMLVVVTTVSALVHLYSWG